MSKPFWKEKSLSQLNEQEWESLCDGCARCCMVKLEDEDTGELLHTNIVCDWLDIDGCKCSDYPNRSINVPTCIKVTPENSGALAWMPPTCAYRLLAEGKDLPNWHPLVSGDASSVHMAGISVAGKVVHEKDADDPFTHIITWIE